MMTFAILQVSAGQLWSAQESHGCDYLRWHVMWLLKYGYLEFGVLH